MKEGKDSTGSGVERGICGSHEDPCNILVVDDAVENLMVLSDILASRGYETRPARSGKLAIESAFHKRPDLILLDVRMPGLDGIEICRRLKADSRTRDIPVIFVSAVTDSEDRVEAFRAGGVDFISKPFQREEVLARVETHLALDVMRRKLEALVEQRTAELTESNRILLDEIAERKRAEADLVESEQRYKGIFDSMTDGLVVMDLEGKILHANPEFCAMHRNSVDHLAGKSINELARPEYSEVYDRFLEEARQGRDIQCEAIHADGSGGEINVEVRGRLFRLKGEERLLAIVRDITGRMRADEALWDHLAFQSVMAAVHAVDPDAPDDFFLRVFLSAVVEHYGFRMAWYGRYEDGVVTPVMSAGCPDARPESMRLTVGSPVSNDPPHVMSMAIATGKPCGRPNLYEDGLLLDCPLRAAGQGCRSNLALPIAVKGVVEGGIIFYSDNVAGFPEERVERLSLLSSGAARMIGERRERRRAREELTRLATVVEQAAEEVIITDSMGKILYVNPAFERISGYTRDEAIGRNPRMLSSGRHQRPFYDALWETLREKGVWKGRIVNKRKDFRVIEVDATISAITDSEGAPMGYVSVRRDVTEEVLLEMQLRQAKKMEAVGVLAGGIAHDFNNILTAIIGYAEMARLFQTNESSRVHLYIDHVLQAGERAKELVQQILTFSRQREGEKTSVLLAPIVEECVRFLRASLPSTIEIRREADSDLIGVFADATQIHQVLMNLCTNAAHAMKTRGGVLTVSLRTILLDGESVARSYPELKPGSYAVLTVSDTGEGISQSLMERIFDPYFTTKEKGEGSGLGLAIVHGIVKSHDGAIRASSAPGEGSVFEVLLPQLADFEEEMEMGGARGVPIGMERILFVDDEPSLVHMCSESLEILGYRVVTAMDGARALQIFRSDPAAFDLVVTDLTMPGLTGEELAMEVKRMRGDVPVLLCTGFVKGLRGPIAFSGIAEVLEKPFSVTDLAQAVRRVLDDSAR